MLIKADDHRGTWFAWRPIRADAGPNAPSGLVWLETVAVGYEEHGLGRTFYRRLARPSPTPWGDAMRARRAARLAKHRLIDSSPQPTPQKCAGECLGNPEPTYYQTPPDKSICKNLRDDGPTPCWYPHCVAGATEQARERADIRAAYRCPACGAGPDAYVNCHRPMCPDGRDH